ncbi:MAG TPA: DUF1003 domain-containing protein [Draconibacterium sp.]|nr:DUF1003 domain-containing protein [Draconibacterium sp.]
MKTFESDVSKKEFPVSERICGKTIRSSIIKLIQKDHPEFTSDNCLTIDELDYYREKYISEYLSGQMEELTEIEKAVLTSLSEKTILSDQLDVDKNQILTFGQRIADKVASFGGSWTFIISFGIFIALWISTNVYWLVNKGFDPYPFILLNLILSCIAALQAPVIMMSQNRQEEKDRERSKKDYMINLKSELEIRMLHEKIDHLMIHQQQELLEIQKVQIEMMSDILKQVNKNQNYK